MAGDEVREMGVIEMEKHFQCHAKTWMYSFREEVQGGIHQEQNRF